MTSDLSRPIAAGHWFLLGIGFSRRGPWIVRKICSPCLSVKVRMIGHAVARATTDKAAVAVARAAGHTAVASRLFRAQRLTIRRGR